MGDDHFVKPSDIERDPEKFTKLEAFRKKAKLPPGSSVPRIYQVFNSLDEFKTAAIQAVAELRRLLDEQQAPQPTPVLETQPTAKPSHPDGIPQPPSFYAEPAYIGTHEFIGRKAQIDTLNDWATPADPHPILLFEAIGGTGKSMLTWHWTKEHANSIRNDWAGVFWYSFYERGAIMADFCRRALSYMTGQPLKELNKKKTLELSDLLLRQLNARPWLLILDGLERVLVAYHRFDAAQVADDEAGQTDKIAQRDPCDAIRTEDDDLLRKLAVVERSKLLLTTRLTPRALLNRANQPIPGVLRERLPGLRPIDAELLLRACGVEGTSQTMQSYLQRHCDCHPLVTGIVAGLVNDYFPDRGNFDAWAVDPNHGGHLNLAELDLVQKRNHILNTALRALSPEGRQLLSSLALLSESADTELLNALNPHLPPKPQEVSEPIDPREYFWPGTSEEERQKALTAYEKLTKVWQTYQNDYKVWQQQVALTPRRLLPETVRDLEWRGLLQYDPNTKRYDLHPVVRGIAAGGLKPAERERCGQPLVDHFSQQTRNHYDDVENFEEVQNELQLIRTLLQMGRYEQASDAYTHDLSSALLFNLNAYTEILTLLQPFFTQDYGLIVDVSSLPLNKKGHLLNGLGLALKNSDQLEEALMVFGLKILTNLKQRNRGNLKVGLTNIASTFTARSRLAKAKSTYLLGIDLAVFGSRETRHIFTAKLCYFQFLVMMGQWEDAKALWQVIDPMGRDWPRNLYRAGAAELYYAQFLFGQKALDEDQLIHAEQLAQKGKGRGTIHSLHELRGEWHLEQEQWQVAAASFREAIRMNREVGLRDEQAEAFLILAQFHLGEVSDSRHAAERLANPKKLSAHRPLAELWLAIGNSDEAKKHALAAYRWAWADGEPYVRRYELDKARELLEKLNVPIPDLPPYDPAKEETYAWEVEVEAAIEKLKAEYEAEKAAE